MQNKRSKSTKTETIKCETKEFSDTIEQLKKGRAKFITLSACSKQKGIVILNYYLTKEDKMIVVEVTIKDKNKQKLLIVHPAHLRKI